MSKEIANNNLFEKYLSILKTELGYIKDASFTWDDIVSLLIIQLTNTDSLNKDIAKNSNATQIQLTSPCKTEEMRITEDFFPTLTLNSSFKRWTLAIPARISRMNLNLLSGEPIGSSSEKPYGQESLWLTDSIQIRRRVLNKNEQSNGNPTLHICFGNDLLPLRKLLHVNDYLVIVKHKGLLVYDVFGVHSSIDLGKGKNMYVSNNLASTDTTSFNICDLIPKFNVSQLISSIKSTHLIYSDLLIKRFAYSLLTKPFVILSGLAGSGKTQLALAFAKCLIHDDSQLCLIPVGADWTNREPLLGYPDALRPGEYITENNTLQLLIDAVENPDKPYFLILDEMNLSYVERYFADFLSAMESNCEIFLWKNGNSMVPKSIVLPKNLFIIGTINVDETTYMFSPKVLDRANVIEFKVNEEEMERYLADSPSVDINRCNYSCSSMAYDFVNISKMKYPIEESNKDLLISFFKQLKCVNAEFGYRSASEIIRFISIAKGLEDKGLEDAPFDNDIFIDAAIVQKLLPKLHGSRRKLNSVFEELWKLCYQNNNVPELNNADSTTCKTARYKLTADKLLRMYRAACDNGFTSFAEA